MKNFDIKANIISILVGIILAVTVFLTLNNMPSVTAEDWCPPPAGCTFSGCKNQPVPNGPDKRVCKFSAIAPGASCGGNPDCGTAPQGGGDGGAETEDGPQV